MLDRRLHAYRPDLAEAGLEGKVEAMRFVDRHAGPCLRPGRRLCARSRTLPRGIDTELLLGEDVTVFDRADGWCWVKAASDGYVGYLPEDRRYEGARCADPYRHGRSGRFLYREAELRKPYKTHPVAWAAAFRLSARRKRAATTMSMLEDGTAIFAKHLQPIGAGDGRRLCRYRTPLPGNALSLGRSLRPRHRLLRPRPAFDADDRHEARRATPTCRRQTSASRSSGPSCAAAIWFSGRGTSPILEDPETIIHANGHTMTVARENFEDCDQAHRLALRAADQVIVARVT